MKAPFTVSNAKDVMLTVTSPSKAIAEVAWSVLDASELLNVSTLTAVFCKAQCSDVKELAVARLDAMLALAPFSAEDRAVMRAASISLTTVTRHNDAHRLASLSQQALHRAQ